MFKFLRMLILVTGFAGLVLADAAEAQVKGWNRIARLTQENLPAQQPDIIAKGDDIHVVFRVRKENFSGIYYLRSRDRGKTWSEPARISQDHRITNYPSILVINETIHVAFVSVRSRADSYQLAYVRSTDDGESWSDVQYVGGRNETTCFYPRLIEVPSGVGIVYCEEERSLSEIKQRLTPDILELYLEEPMKVLFPLVRTTSSRVNIKLTRSLDGGETWRPASYTGATQDEIFNLVIFQESPSKICVSWDTSLDMFSKRTESGGEMKDWRNDLTTMGILPRTSLFDVALSADKELHIARIERKAAAFSKLPVLYKFDRKEEVALAPPAVIRSAPHISADDGDVHIVWSVQEREDIWINYIRTDRVPPVSRIIFPTEPDVTTPVFTVEWEGEDNLSPDLEYHWRINKEEWHDWITETRVDLKASKDGDYQFQLVARDYAGNLEATPQIYKFNTYKVAPDTRFAGTVPPTVMSRYLRVAWMGEDNATAPDLLEYQTKLDDKDWSEFGREREILLKNLTEGRHMLQVRARDEIGNVDASPAEAYFNVVIGIEVRIVGNPQDYIGENQATFQWEASDQTRDNVDFYFSSRIDGSAWSSPDTNLTRTFTDLNEGNHEVRVRASDAIQNVSAREASFAFIVDLTPPESDLAVKYTGKETNYFPEVEFSGRDTYTATEDLLYQYRVDEGEWSDWTKELKVLIPKPIKRLSWGYVVQVRAKDRAGLVDPTPATKSLLIYVRYGIYILAIPAVLVGGILIFFFIILLGRLFGGRPTAEPEGGPRGEAPEDDIFGGTTGGAPSAQAGKKPSDDDDDLFG